MSSILKPGGLKTYISELSPDRTENLGIADNTVIDIPYTIQKRRGFEEIGQTFGTSSDRLNQLLVYKDRILRHFGSTIQYDSNGSFNFQTFDGTFNEIANSGKIRSAEVNSNLYFTTDSGIKKISANTSSDFSTATNFITDAGGVKAIDLKVSPSYTIGGFMPPQSKCAYRLVWGIKDKNNNLILGYPSERFIVTNTSSNINIPEKFTTTIVSSIKSTYIGKYILCSSKSTDYMFWFSTNINETAPADSNTIGRTAIRVDISSSLITTTQGYAGSLANTIAIVGEFTVTSSLNVVTVEVSDKTSGNVIDASSNDLTNLLVVVTQQGEVTIGKTADADIIFSVPNSIITASDPTRYFYQIYRTSIIEVVAGLTLNDIDPGDEMNLVLESPITIIAPATVPTSTLKVQDTTPENFRDAGTLLYINPISGAGITQANERPPISKDIALFRNSTFYANTKTVHRKQIDMLSVTEFVSGTSDFIITDNSFPTPVVRTYTFQGAQEKEEITIPVAKTSASLDGTYFLINSANDEYKYFAWFDNTGTTAEPNDVGTTGRNGIKIDVIGVLTETQIALAIATSLDLVEDFVSTSTLSVVTIERIKNGAVTNTVDSTTLSSGLTFGSILVSGIGEDTTTNKVLLSGSNLTPTPLSPSQSIEESARSLIRVINADISSPVYAFYLSGEADLPGKIMFENRTLKDVQFNITTTHAAIQTKFNPELTSINTDVVSSNDVSKNRVYYSKVGQPEAVPQLNYLDIGQKDKEIKRIIALRDNTFCLKEDGIYIITGSTAPNFSSRLLDRSTQVFAPDTAVVLNNEIYCLSSQGIVKITETGVSIISRPIEDKILAVVNSDFNYKDVVFGVAYESDRAYVLWLQNSPTDTVPTQAYRYNVITKTWTRWTKEASCGAINPSVDKLYIGSGTRNTLEQERKNRNRTDYADRDFTNALTNNVITSPIYEVGSSTGITAGDVILQQQYLTIATFNRLLLKLDKDSGLNDIDYSTSLEMLPGTLLNTKLDTLNAKLIVDNSTGSITNHAPFSTDFSTMQSQYNLLINDLNLLSTDTTYKNYQQSTGTVEYEVPITIVDTITNKLTGTYIVPFMSGQLVIFKGIDTIFEFSTQSFGSPETLKQIPTASVLLNQNDFSSIKISFKSDLSPSFEVEEFFGEGIGNYGYLNYGNNTYGGGGTDVGVRVLVPRDKQRCRYLDLKVEHINARENINCLGITMQPRILSTRGYR